LRERLVFKKKKKNEKERERDREGRGGLLRHYLKRVRVNESGGKRRKYKKGPTLPA